MTFETCKALDEWVEEHSKKCKSYATGGEHYSFHFLPSGIVECQTVKCLCCKEQKTFYTD